MNSGILAQFNAQTAGKTLREHLAICEEYLGLVARENQALREEQTSALPEFAARRKDLLPRLDCSLDSLRKHRQAWQRLDAAERARHPEVATLLRANQDLIMKAIVLDRENEQALLRLGLASPRHLPPAARQRPHYVAALYQRNTGK